jgi:hypothetical protein
LVTLLAVSVERVGCRNVCLHFGEEERARECVLVSTAVRHQAARLQKGGAARHAEEGACKARGD